MYGFESGKPDFSNKHANHRQQIEPLLSLYQDGEANPEERHTVEYFLARCPECRLLLTNFQQVETDLRGYLAGVSVPRLDMSLFRQEASFIEPATEGNVAKFTSPVQRENLYLVPPLIEGKQAPSQTRRSGFAYRFGGTFAACGLLLAVGLLLVLSIQSLNGSKPPPAVTDVAYVTTSSITTPEITNNSPTTNAATTSVPATTEMVSNNPTPSPGSPATSPRVVNTSVSPTINSIANTTTLIGIKPVTTASVTTAATTNIATKTTLPAANPTIVLATTNSGGPRVTTTAPVSVSTSLPASVATTTPPVVTAPSTVASSSPVATTAIPTPDETTITSSPTTLPANTVTSVASVSVVTPNNFTTTSNATTSSVAASITDASDTARPSLATPVLVTTTFATTISATPTLADTTKVTTPIATTLGVTPTAPVNLASPPIHAAGLLAYVSSKDGEIHLVSSDGTNEHLLTHNTPNIMWQELVWSPDARWLAAVGQVNGIDSIYLLDTNANNLDMNPVIEGVQPVWSFDSRMLAYLANVNVESGVQVGKSRVIDLKHRLVTHLNDVATGFAPQWFPDNQRLLVGQQDIYKISPTTKTSTYDVTLVQHLGLSFLNTCIGVGLSPDGTQLAVLEHDKSGAAQPVIYNLNNEGDLVRKPLSALKGLGDGLKTGRSCGDNRLNWTPTGHSIFFYVQSGSSYYNALISTTTGEVSYQSGVYAPNFSADGAYLADFNPATRQAYAISSSLAGRPTNPYPVAQAVVIGPVWQPKF